MMRETHFIEVEECGAWLMFGVLVVPNIEAPEVVDTFAWEAERERLREDANENDEEFANAEPVVFFHPHEDKTQYVRVPAWRGMIAAMLMDGLIERCGDHYRGRLDSEIRSTAHLN